MNTIQRVLCAIYLPLTILLLIADRLYPGEDLVNYIKFTTVVTIFLAALVTSNKYSVQKLLTIAAFFTVTGDFFLNFGNTLQDLKQTLIPLGMLGYAIAYIILIIAFQKNFKLNKFAFIAAIPVLGVYIPMFIKLSPSITGVMYYAAFVFGLILCYMTWTAICTLFRGYFSIKSSRFIALAGFLILISDMGVAHSLFNPTYKNQFVPWLENVIWLTFIPAWTLILMVIAEEKVNLCSFPSQKQNLNIHIFQD